MIHRCRLAVILGQYYLATNADPGLQVILGEYDVSVDEGSEQRRAIAQMLFSDLSAQPQGGPAQGEENDIALIRIDRPVQFSTYVKAIALPEFQEEFAGMLQ